MGLGGEERKRKEEGGKRHSYTTRSQGGRLVFPSPPPCLGLFSSFVSCFYFSFIYLTLRVFSSSNPARLQCRDY